MKKLILAEKNFSRVFIGSGVTGFFGLPYEYWFHCFLNIFFNVEKNIYTNSVFVSKTATFFVTHGNLALQGECFRPREWLPRCICVDPMLRYVVNAVGLANPGLQALLDRNIWQQRSQPFVISVALVLSSIKKRLFELDGIINILKNYGRDFLKNIIIELNLSCPNTDVLPMQLLQEVPKYLDTFGTAGIPVILKVSVAQTEQEEELVTGLLAIQDHSALVGIHVSNTVPWKSRFNPLRSRRSPLHWRGLDADGGYSGVGAIEHSCRVVKKLREAGFTKHVTLGGGILHPDHVLQAWLVGANAISIASAFILRPWWIKEIFAKAAQLDWSAPLEERSVS